MDDLAFRSASALATLLRERKVGAEELLDHFVARIDKLNARVNAVVATDIGAARRRARAADAALAAGESWGPLHGLPMTVKETFDVAGMASTWGVVELKNHRPARNALAVERLIGAGAVVFGKTNVSAYLVGSETRNEVFGTTTNPWDTDRSPGGSAGGAGAALAAGLTALEAGVDIAGGIRNVAHYCGVFAHKPTWGITDLSGHVFPGLGTKPDIAVIGPMARSADDLALALSIIAGPDPADAVAWTLSLPKPRKASLKDLKIAVILELPGFPVDDEVKARVEAVAAFLARSGATVDRTARPAIDPAAAARIFGGLLLSTLSVREGDRKLWDKLAHVRKQFFDTADDEHVLSHADWLAFDNGRNLMRRLWANFFSDFDALICPAAPTAACPLEDRDWQERTIKVNGKSFPVSIQVFWTSLFSVARLPATVAPAGFTKAGLPVGVQIVSGEYRDLTAIAIARHVERDFQSFVAPKGW